MIKVKELDVRDEIDGTDAELPWLLDCTAEAVDKALAAERERRVAIFAKFGWDVLKSYGSFYRVEKEFPDGIDEICVVSGELADIHEEISEGAWDR